MICDHAVLSAVQERALFLQYNFRKFQAAQARRRIDPARVNRRQLQQVDRLLARATDVRNCIVRANLRLAVAVAKKHLRPGISLAELVNEGSLTLMRAAESFDTRRGNKFSTYATLALMKGYARTVGQLRSGPASSEMLDTFAAPGRTGFDRVEAADRVSRLLAPLAPTERAAVCRQFDLHADDTFDDKIAAPVMRRLQRSAMDKLRAMSGE